MDNLRFGHKVIAWDINKDRLQKGKLIRKTKIGCYDVLINDNIVSFVNCELDPNADEFLIGDEVEASFDGRSWERGVYKGHTKDDTPHWVSGGCWKYCRYPRKEKDSCDGKVVEIDGKKYKLQEVE